MHRGSTSKKKPLLIATLVSLAITAMVVTWVENRNQSDIRVFRNVLNEIPSSFQEYGYYEELIEEFRRGNLIQVNSNFEMKYRKLIVVNNPKRFIAAASTELTKSVPKASKVLGTKVTWTLDKILESKEGGAVIELELHCFCTPRTIGEFFKAM